MAARDGDCDTVAAWLESDSGRGSFDDVEGLEHRRTLLLLTTFGPGRAEHCDFDERHVALARYLVERGADGYWQVRRLLARLPLGP